MRVHMKKSLIALLVAAPLTFSLTGCIVVADGEDHVLTTDHEDHAYKNRKAIARISLGASYSSVANQMGVADFSEAYEKDGKTVQVLFYRTNRVHKDGLTTRDECTYLYFIDGSLQETGLGGDFSRNIQH